MNSQGAKHNILSGTRVDSRKVKGRSLMNITAGLFSIQDSQVCNSSNCSVVFRTIITFNKNDWYKHNISYMF